MEKSSPSTLKNRLLILKEQYDLDVNQAHMRVTHFLRRLQLLAGVVVCLSVGVFATRGINTTEFLVFLVLFGLTAMLLGAIGGRRREQLEIARGRAKVCSEMIARLEYRWEQLPLIEVQHPQRHSTMAEDLSIFGRVSLMQLLCVAETMAGREELSERLLHPATSEVVRERESQARVLMGQTQWRLELQRLCRRLESPMGRTTRIKNWVEGTSDSVVPRWLAIYSKVLPLLWAGLIAVGVWNLPAFALSAVGLIVVNLLLTVATSGVIHSQWEQIAPAISKGTLASFAGVIRHLTKIPTLAAGCGLQANWHRSAIASLDQLDRLFFCISITKNPMTIVYLYLPLQLLLLWDQRVATALEKWRLGAGSSLPQWLNALTQAELASCFATLAEANPNWSSGELETSNDNVIRAKGMGHPLIPRERRVCNDLEIGPPGTVVIVTGSNMGGKSTLLRALGLNVVLAQSGACCCCDLLELPPTQVVTDMGTSDSLENSESLFLAQLRQLRDCIDTIRNNSSSQASRVTLFLFDELLNGTNATDRRILVEQLLSFLKRQHAIGVVTTHDTELASLLGKQEFVTNFHMTHSQNIEANGGLRYDYILREGVSSTSNAIALARLLGIEAEAE